MAALTAEATPKPAPPKVAYHPNVRCRRGDGCTCGAGRGKEPNWPHSVIVGPMYRVGEVCVCEGAASEEEKANGPVKPPVEGFDLRGWEAADIEGLRDADGRLDLKGAILCGVDLKKAELQGALLEGAQLQGVNLERAQLQGAVIGNAQLQGAELCNAQLQAVNFYGSHLQGASLYGAQLQGAIFHDANLQGADLRNADLSVLPKGFHLPKEGSAGETEATEQDRPAFLLRANLSVLPKGSEYRYCGVLWECGGGVKVSDAIRHTNLTGAKASGANFLEANLSGADFTSANIKDATLKDATFAPLKLPGRPASGALSGAWRGKALMGGMARAAMAAADDDDDDSDDGSDDDEEEESPVEAEIEKVLEGFMDKLATTARDFMHTVDGMVGKVQDLLKSSLLKSCEGTQSTSSASVLDADSILAELLCKKLETANDKQAAIFETLSTHVISPLFAQHLPKVLKDARTRSELLKPSDEAGAAEHQLLEQLLETFTERALGAGKAALLKRLSPIVSKCVGAVFSITEGSAEGGGPFSRRASSRRSVGPGPAVDEEQPLMRPGDSAACLVQELWQALCASLEAQVRSP